MTTRLNNILVIVLVERLKSSIADPSLLSPNCFLCLQSIGRWSGSSWSFSQNLHSTISSFLNGRVRSETRLRTLTGSLPLGGSSTTKLGKFKVSKIEPLRNLSLDFVNLWLKLEDLQKFKFSRSKERRLRAEILNCQYWPAGVMLIQDKCWTSLNFSLI